MTYLSTAWGADSWTDVSELIWAVTTSSGSPTAAVLYQVYTDDLYVYAAHSTGVNIFDLQSEALICYAEVSSGFNSVVGNSENVYLGTSSSGVFYFSKSIIYGTSDSLGNISSMIYPLATTYLPSCSSIISLFIYNYDLAVTTSNGLEVIGMAPGREFKSTTVSSGIIKSFLTSKKEVYYLEEISGTTALKMTTPYSCDWVTADVTFIPGYSFIVAGVIPIDLYITEYSTSGALYNTIFLATTSGVYVYDEGTTTTDIYL